MRITREEAIRSLRQKRAYEKALEEQERAGLFMAVCSMLAGYLLLMAIG